MAQNQSQTRQLSESYIWHLGTTTMRDPIFELKGDSQWNACIGDQGAKENYLDGYIEAATTLAEAIIEGKMYGKRDTLILPILYNARHAIELMLKFAIDQLAVMGVFRRSHPRNHDIMSHWKLLANNNLGDETLRLSVLKLEPFVLSLSRIDDDGQELRYPENTDGDKSLSDIALVNLVVVRNSLVELSNTLTEMKYRLYSFESERNTGSFTNDLSRRDLFEFARKLPALKKWKEAEFDEAKTALRKQYGLSGKRFSSALDVIKRTRELKVVLGEETNLIHISDENAIFVIEQWKKLHPRYGNTEAVVINLEDALQSLNDDMSIADRRKLFATILDRLSPDEIADVHTIYYLSRNGEFSEFYEENLVMAKKIQKQGGAELQLGHIMLKTNFLTEFIKGVHMLGRPTLAERLNNN